MDTLEHQLKTALRGKVCILGVGNRMRGDDGAGSWLVGRVAGGVAADLLDGGVAPENYLEKAARNRPDTVLVVDAVDFGGAAGEIRLFDSTAIHAGGLSTHALSLRMAFEYLTARCSASIVLAAIQPVSIGLAQDMSEPVRGSIERLARALRDVLPQA
ncbi:MAG: hydrogenase 3 maturation endopeptidase HyCI [Verrucomicrobiota bacterium]